MEKRDVPGVHCYDAPAGGWGALRATAKAVAEQMHLAEAPALLLQTNKPNGFDCPGCACYAIDDKQYVVTAAGGHGSFCTKIGDYVIAYSLQQ